MVECDVERVCLTFPETQRSRLISGSQRCIESALLGSQGCWPRETLPLRPKCKFSLMWPLFRCLFRYLALGIWRSRCRQDGSDPGTRNCLDHAAHWRAHTGRAATRDGVSYLIIIISSPLHHMLTYTCRSSVSTGRLWRSCEA